MTNNGIVNEDVVITSSKQTQQQQEEYYTCVHTCENEPITIYIPNMDTITVNQFSQLVFNALEQHSMKVVDAGNESLMICYLDIVINSKQNENLLLKELNIPFRAMILSSGGDAVQKEQETFLIARNATNLYVRNEITGQIFDQLNEFRKDQFNKQNNNNAEEEDVKRTTMDDTQKESFKNSKLEFPVTLPSTQRKFVHAIAEQLNLHHQSTGNGSNRRITVWYRKSGKKNVAAQATKKNHPTVIITTDNKKSKSNIPKGMSTVIPDFLFLGSGRDANDIEQLLANKITHIVNCTIEWPAFHALPESIKLKRVPLKDVSSTNISQEFEHVHSFLDDVRKSGGRVLVHCTIGRSRSATIVLGYLMKAENMNLGQSHSHLIRCRDIIKPNDGFMRQLMAFENQLFNGQYSNTSEPLSKTLVWEFNEPPAPTEEEMNKMREAKKRLLENVDREAELIVPENALRQLVEEDLNGELEKEGVGSFIQRVIKNFYVRIQQSGLPEKDLRNAVGKRAKNWYSQQFAN